MKYKESFHAESDTLPPIAMEYKGVYRGHNQERLNGVKKIVVLAYPNKNAEYIERYWNNKTEKGEN